MPPNKGSIKDIKILIADSDSNLGILLTNVLLRMGFKHIQFVRDGVSAKKALELEHKDILITEWHMQSVDGIELTNFIRNSDDPAIRFLPIIMLTARAEKQDVEAARDAGITEFVVKPYNSLTIFRRIQQVIDNPRGFLLTPQYVGPDRRRRSTDGLSGPDRRKANPEVITSPDDAKLDESGAKLIKPDFVLKKRTGTKQPLDTIITSKQLEGAQKVIDDLKDTSLSWIKVYVEEMDECLDKMEDHNSIALMKKLGESLLAIKANAGTFGYSSAADVAYQLYQFLRFDYNKVNPKHSEVLVKHAQALKIILSHAAEGKILDKQDQLLAGLNQLAAKFRTTSK